MANVTPPTGAKKTGFKDNELELLLFRAGTLLVVIGLIWALYFGNTYLHDFQTRASAVSGVWHFFAFFFFILACVLAWKVEDWATGRVYYIYWLLALFLAVQFACGWNFDMFGVPDRP